MTQREKLSQRIDEVLVTYNALVDNYRNIVGDRSIYTNRNYPSRVRESAKLSEMKDFISRTETSIEKLTQLIAVESFYLTDEGISLKAKLNAKRDKLYDNISSYNKNQITRISNLIMQYLDSDWLVDACEARIDIGLKETKRDGFKFIFGHSFEMYYNTWGSNPRLELNYGTMGSFDVLDPNCVRPKYLLGLAAIANNKDLIIALTEIMENWNKVRRELFYEIDDIENVLKNPIEA